MESPIRRKIERVILNTEDSLKTLRIRLDTDMSDVELLSDLLYAMSRMANDVACYGTDCLHRLNEGETAHD